MLGWLRRRENDHRPGQLGEYDRDQTGAIIAPPADYAVVRELVAEVFAEGIEATVPATVRETVDAVAALKKNELSLGEHAAKLALDKSAPSRRLRDAPALAISSTWRAVE